MGLHKHEGDAALALAEECAEVIQVIAKLKRFNGSWHEIPPGKTQTRAQELEAEMSDLLFQWERLKSSLYAMSS
jgi:NTP pyrophosphatase (non-canonical NTP hydrolase)